MSTPRPTSARVLPPPRTTRPSISRVSVWAFPTAPCGSPRAGRGWTQPRSQAEDSRTDRRSPARESVSPASSRRGSACTTAHALLSPSPASASLWEEQMDSQHPKTEAPAFFLDLRSQAFQQDPFPTLAKMRQLGPVIRARLPWLGTVWLTTTHDAATELLHDHRHFVQSPAENRWMRAILRWLPRTLQPVTTNMLLRDEPDHRRLRHLVERAFRVRSIEALRPRLEVLADEAADGLARQASRSPHGVDLLVHFARPFPLA